MAPCIIHLDMVIMLYQCIITTGSPLTLLSFLQHNIISIGIHLFVCSFMCVVCVAANQGVWCPG